MATYLDLRTDIADEMAAGDLVAAIPRFVRQATQRINRDVRISDMQRRARAPGNNTRYLRCPEGFLEARRLWNVTNLSNERRQSTKIEQVAPHELIITTAGGRLPAFWAMHRTDPPEIEFDVSLADDREVEMIYTKAYAEFAADGDTNWLLDNHYDIYFQASLYAAEEYVRNFAQAQARATDYQRALDELNRSERRQSYMQPTSSQATQPVF